MPKVGSQKIALIDYNSFKLTENYVDSINELIDILLRKQYEIYALFCIDTDKSIPPIDAYISGVIPYRIMGLTNSGINISEDIYKTTGCISAEDILIISSNPMLLSTVEQLGYKICLINNGHNDIVSLSGSEINHIHKLNKVLR
jgi:hypothetical protein